MPSCTCLFVPRIELKHNSCWFSLRTVQPFYTLMLDLVYICKWTLKNIWFCFWIVLVRYVFCTSLIFSCSTNYLSTVIKEFIIIFVVRKAGISNSAVFTQTVNQFFMSFQALISSKLSKCVYEWLNSWYFLCFCKVFHVYWF